MLRNIVSTRVLITGVLFFLLIVGGSQLYYWHLRHTLDEEVEQTQRSVQALTSPTAGATAQEITEISPPVSAYTENAPENHESGTPPPETSAAAEIDTSLPRSEDNLLLSETEEDPLPIGSTDEFYLETLADWTEDLQSRMQAKYPEIMEFPTLTAEDFANRYPTEEDRQRFRQRAREMVDDFLSETKELFSSLPPELSVQVMEELHRQFSATWGQDTADKAMRDLQQFIE